MSRAPLLMKISATRSEQGLLFATDNRVIASSIVFSWILMAGLIAISFLPITFPEWALYLPFVLSFVFLGLPHGGADHWILITLRNQSTTFTTVLQAVLPYVLIAGLYFIVWWIAPTFSFFLFIGITWFHWGQGDVYSLTALTGSQHLSSRWHLVTTAFIRGGLPMLVPLLAFPEIYYAVANDVVGAIASNDLSGYGLLFSDTFRLGAGIVFGLVILIYLAATFNNRRSWYVDAAETGLLVSSFALVHPVLAIGIYFCFWHGLRHILRILCMQGWNTEDRMRHSAGTFASQTIPTTLAGLALLAVLYIIVPEPPKTMGEFIGLYLILIAVLTLPHVWVVSKMDAQDQVWKPVTEKNSGGH